ncbi:MAG: hypothetical protein ABL874_10995 [Sphingopyxis sp.]
MTTIAYFITRQNDLFANGNFIERFTSEEAAADMAVRFAQDNDALWSILLERRR